MGQAIVDAGGHEAELVTNVIAGAFKAFCEHTLRLIQGVDGIGKLDLAACCRSLVLKNLEDFWRQQVTADDGQVAWRFFCFRFFYETVDIVQSWFQFGIDINDAVFRCFFLRHRHNRNVRRMRAIVSANQLVLPTAPPHPVSGPITHPQA